jgi:hypothetical protein|tara:strand:- start:488 stop:595 length:108 start_codon:yes stop_codon:yes gene_type:complete
MLEDDKDNESKELDEEEEQINGDIYNKEPYYVGLP